SPSKLAKSTFGSSKFSCVFALVSKTNTLPTELSETMTFTPSGETANTLPVTDDTLAVTGVVATGSNSISPPELPRKALVPALLKTIEFAAKGNVIDVPAVLAATSIGMRLVLADPSGFVGPVT